MTRKEPVHTNTTEQIQNIENCKRKALIYKGKLIRITSAETLEARKAWNNVFQALRVKNCQPR
jgi:hypothetical protein